MSYDIKYETKKEIEMGHSFTRRLRCIPWAVCIHCGLIRLNNEATKKAKCERE